MKQLPLIVAILTLSASHIAFADTPPDSSTTNALAAGHSQHGEAFNDGPRQAPYLMGGTGKISFPITTGSKKAKRFFLQGLGQLHGFWYFESERSFRQVAFLDPTCAIAYWGMAQSNIRNEKRARGFLAKAITLKESASEREQAYIDSFAAFLGIPTALDELKKIESLADYKPKRSDKDRRSEYVRKLEELVLDYPDDIEAKAFLLVLLWQNTRHGLPMNSTLAADAISQQILAANPMHPVHHYRIHIWDGRKPDVALDAAAACGFAAPSVAHMWHMGGHIYSKEKRYADAAWHQEASARTDHMHMMHDQTLPDQIHNFAHNNEWLTRNLIYLGRVPEALDLAKNMTELPRHPTYNTLKKGSARYGRARLITVLTECELWEQALSLTTGSYIEPTDIPREQINRLRLIGRAAYGLNDIAKGDSTTKELKALTKSIADKHHAEDHKKQEAKKKADKEKADKKAKERADKAKKELAAKTDKKETPEEKKDDKPDAKVAAKDDKNNGTKDKKADKKDRKPETKVAAKDKKKKDAKHKEPKKSSDEIFADTVLRELGLARALTEGTAKDAIGEKDFKSNGIDKNLMLQLYIAAENFDKAIELSAQEVKRRKNQTLPLARHVHALYAAGKLDEARESFVELRALSQNIALDVPVFKRLDAIASAFDAPSDWREDRPVPGDIRKRPELDDLGPFRWRPSLAKSWTLPDHNGRYTSLAEQNQDQNILLIFYLGAECLHCVEQLGAFSPKVQAYADAGIKIIAISLEDKVSLKESITAYSQDTTPTLDLGKKQTRETPLISFVKDGAFPFLLLADEKEEIFKRYRAYDDFEQTALHGTFLIDKQGYVRWQDISYEPFTKPDYLLKECIRLLAQPDDIVHGPRDTKPLRLKFWKKN